MKPMFISSEASIDNTMINLTRVEKVSKSETASKPSIRFVTTRRVYNWYYNNGKKRDKEFFQIVDLLSVVRIGATANSEVL